MSYLTKLDWTKINYTVFHNISLNDRDLIRQFWEKMSEKMEQRVNKSFLLHVFLPSSWAKETLMISNKPKLVIYLFMVIWIYLKTLFNWGIFHYSLLMYAYNCFRLLYGNSKNDNVLKLMYVGMKGWDDSSQLTDALMCHWCSKHGKNMVRGPVNKLGET